jgi:hypothetical protein
MKNKINILKEMVEAKKPTILSEGIKIFKSKRVENGRIRDPKDPSKKINKGPGYWIYISSDEPEGNDHRDEAIQMSSILNLSDGKKFAFLKENPGVGRPNYYKNPESGQFGWGYFIDDRVIANNKGLQEKMLGWLQGLVRKYNTEKGLQDDVKTGKLTLDQVEEINDLVSAIEDASVMNPETKAKLEQYLDDLTAAIENDEVFEFLTKKYNEAKEFIRNNKRAGTTKEGWDYTVTNTFIIRAADPSSILAAPKEFWTGRGYRIKPGVRGISIRYPKGKGTGSAEYTSKALARDPEAFKAYKEKHGLPQSATWKDVMRTNADKHMRGMAYDAIRGKKVRTTFSKPETDFFGTVYTDTMVEPVPGKEVMSISQMIETGKGNDEPIQDPYHITQKELESETHKEKLNTLFKATLDVAERRRVNTQGMGFKDGDINEFNKVLNAIAFDEAIKKLPHSMGIKGAVTPEVEEMIYGYSEAIANIVKKYYGLPSDESKYNVARQGVDREEIQRVYSEIIRISDRIVNEIDKTLETEQTALNEVRKLVRNVLRNI